MPTQVEVEGVGTLEFPDDFKPEEIQRFVREKFSKPGPRTSGLGAAERSFIEAAPATAVGMATAESLMPLARVLAPATRGVSYGIPLIGGAITAGIASMAEKPVIRAIDPEFEELQRMDIEQYPKQAMLGRLAAIAPSAQFTPVQGIKGLASIPKAIFGSAPARTEARKAAGETLINIGLQEALTTGQTVLGEGRLPSMPEAIESGIAGVAFSKSRFHRPEVAPEIRPVAPEEMAARKQALLDIANKEGDRLLFVEGPMKGGAPQDVAHMLPDGRMEVSDHNFQMRVENERASGVSVDEAIRNVWNEEKTHQLVLKFPDSGKRAIKFWNNLTKAEQYWFKRKLLGPDYKARTDYDAEKLGQEAIRFAIQRAKKVRPGEHIFGPDIEVKASKVMTFFEDTVRWMRENLSRKGTKASQENVRYINELLSHIESIKKGEPHALDTEATSFLRAMRHKSLKGEENMSVAERLAAYDARGRQEAERLETLRKEKILLGPKDSPMPGEELGNAVIIDWRSGKPVLSEAKTHPEALEKAGGAALAEEYPTQETRNWDDIAGWRTNRRPFVPRSLGTKIAEASGQDLRTWEQKADAKPVHTDEARSAEDPTKTISGEKVPPAAQPEGAQPVQEPTVLATQPPASTTAGGPAAKPTISTAFSESKLRELDALSREVVDPSFKPHSPEGMAKFERYAALTAELEAAEAAAGAAPAKQEGKVLAMTSKGYSLRTRDGKESGRFLLPAVDMGDGTYITGSVHREAFLKAYREREVAGATAASKPQNQGFLDENGKFRSRFEAAKIFKEITGRTPATPDSLTSEDLVAMDKEFEPKILSMTSKEKGYDYSPEDMFGIDKFADLPITKPGSIPIVIEHNDGTRSPAISEGWGMAADLKNDRLVNRLWVSYPMADEYGRPSWTTGPMREGDKIVAGNPHAEPLAMTSKIKPPETPEEVVRRIAITVGGIKGDPRKQAIVENTASLILSRPKEQWHDALTEFHLKWRQRQIESEDRARLLKDMGISAQDLTETLSPENIALVFGAADRSVAYRSALYVLNGKISPVLPQERAAKPGEEPKPAKQKLSVRYEYGNYDEFWTDFNERYPHIPQWVAKEVWVQAVYDYLNNASSERLIEMLRPAKLEKKYLGKSVAQYSKELGKLDVSMLRVIPDIEPQIVLDILKAPSPKDTAKFKRFVEARGLTVERGLEVLKQLDQEFNRSLQAQHAYEEEGLTVGGKMLRTKAGKMVMPGGRELVVGESLRKQRKKEWERAVESNMRRRHAVIADLAKWLIGKARLAEANPMRRTFDKDQIWWEVKGQRGAYVQYEAQQQENIPFINDSLKNRGGVTEGRTASTSRQVAGVVNTITGDFHLVSVYIRDKVPRIYDPSGIPGSKEGGYLSVSEVIHGQARTHQQLGRDPFRFVSSMLLRDPVFRFHEKFTSEKGKSGLDKYMEKIGNYAATRENASTEEWRRYILAAEKERAAERERAKQERFFGKATEEEVTGELKSAAETTAEAEAAQREQEESGEVESAREEEVAPSVRERIAAAREEAGGRPWEEGEDWDPEMVRGAQSQATRDALEAWREATRTGRELRYMSGRQAIHNFETDLRHLAESPLHPSEVESLYLLMRELKIEHPTDFTKLIELADKLLAVPTGHTQGLAGYLRYRQPRFQMRGMDVEALYALDKISEKIFDRMYNSAYEQAKLRGLPEIPPDTAYIDMSEGQKARYNAVEAMRFRALLRTFDRVYEIFKDTQSIAGPARETPAGRAVTADVEHFRTRALDNYGDTARRDLEQAAVSAQQAAQNIRQRIYRPSGVLRELFGGPGVRPEPRLTERFPEKFPRAGAPPEMLTPEQRAAVAAEARVRYPYIPTAAGYQRPMLTPKGAQVELSPLEGRIRPWARRKFGEAEISPIGPRPQGFVPRAPSRRELLSMPPEEAKRYQASQRMPRPLREKGTQQLLLRKIAEQSEGGKPLAMTRKGIGVANIYQEELLAMGRTTFKKEQLPFVPKAVLIARGQELVTSGKINPIKEMLQFERLGGTEGYMSVDSMLAWRYWDYKLQSWADEAAELYGPKSKTYDRMEKASSSWKDRMQKSGKHQFAKLGHALQGWNQIGPDDMKSTTFVRRFLKKMRAKEQDVDYDDAVLTDEDEVKIKEVTRKVTAGEDATSEISILIGEAVAKDTDATALDPGQAKAVGAADAAGEKLYNHALDVLRATRPDQLSMAAKADKVDLPKLPDELEDVLGNMGMRVLQRLAKANDLTDARWLAVMTEELNKKAGRPDLVPYLPHIRTVSEILNETFLNNIIGTGDPVKDARAIFTRKRPTVEESVAALQRALDADPSGSNITPVEGFHIWNYLRHKYIDPAQASPADRRRILDFKKIREEISKDIHITNSEGHLVPYDQFRLFKSMSAKRSMRVMTEELLKRMRDEARLKSAAMNWLRNQQYPSWLRTIRLFPRLFFLDKILGHGLVPMITHAPTMLFNPQAWSVYFGKFEGGVWKPGAWQEMYRMSFGTQPFQRLGAKLGIGEWKGMKGADYHQLKMDELTSNSRFEFWKHYGLECDPFKYTDDFLIEKLEGVMGEKFRGWIGGRGFDALKTLRFAMAEKWMDSLPEHLQREESAKLIADSVNHATGIVKTSFHEAANWLMFAPKLEASRWAYMFKDTIKAIDIMAKGNKATLEQRHWAETDLTQKAAIIGWYAGMLAANQAFLWMQGDKQKINAFDPTKPDWLQFKVAGYRVGVMSPLIGVWKLLGHAAHISFGQRTKFERMTPRGRALGKEGWQYVRGKMSPLSGFATDIVTAQDFADRPIQFLPWSEPLPRSKMIRGVKPYRTAEYIRETIAPIPLEEAFRETWGSMGIDEATSKRLMRALVIAGGMSATGARIVGEEAKR